MGSMTKTDAKTADIYPSREVLLEILDAMFDELYVLDADNICIYVNKACERHYNLSPGELIGRSLLDSVHSGYWSPGIGVIAAKEKRVATFEMLSNTGKKLMVTASPLLDAKGNVSMIVENIRDIDHLMHEQTDIETTRELFSRYYTCETLPELEASRPFLVADSPLMRETLETARLAAKTASNILLTGPTGSGKNALARYIHESSQARKGKLITINCSAIPDQLFESELFGYAYGAFSGAAAKGKKGIVELAQNGTLVLDEVNSIPYHLQSKLLHFLEERTFAPIGSNKIHRSTCRILAATNQNLPSLVQRGEFRADLYYRLSVLEINVPALAERREDVRGLAQNFLVKCNEKLKTKFQLTPDALDFLESRAWPGNVRELENCIERFTALSPGSRLDEATVRRLLPPSSLSLPARLPETAADGEEPFDACAPLPGEPLDDAVARLEKSMITAAWAKGRSSYAVARLLGISQNRAYRLIKKYIRS